jgi:hypothetical protein
LQFPFLLDHSHNGNADARADYRDNDVSDRAVTVDPYEPQYSAADESADYADDDISQYGKSASHDLTCKPACDSADNNSNNDIHFKSSLKFAVLSATHSVAREDNMCKVNMFTDPLPAVHMFPLPVIITERSFSDFLTYEPGHSPP